MSKRSRGLFLGLLIGALALGGLGWVSNGFTNMDPKAWGDKFKPAVPDEDPADEEALDPQPEGLVGIKLDYGQFEIVELHDAIISDVELNKKYDYLLIDTDLVDEGFDVKLLPFELDTYKFTFANDELDYHVAGSVNDYNITFEEGFNLIKLDLADGFVGFEVVSRPFVASDFPNGLPE